MTWKDALGGLRGRVTPDRPMAGLSWLRTGGAAEMLYQPADLADLQAFMRILPADVPLLPVGVCSNLIVRDGGVRGVVLRLGRAFGDVRIDGEDIQAGAAVLDKRVAILAAEAGLDLTFLRTIPGTLGGAVAMNAGCYGAYMADVVTAVQGVTRAGEVVTLPAADLAFAYRDGALPEGFVVTQVHLRAPRGTPDALAAKMEAQLAKRAQSQPVGDLSCGSTFRNPAGFSSTGQADDSHELKAWSLIDRAGLRGATLGGAQMSPKHPNFLVNTGTATAADLEGLGEEVRKKVFLASGIQLEWEIKRVGEFADAPISPNP
ncbi:MAG: UDP-N-acetylmuramate dehydrogenase [Pseudomonadota bacterium]